MICTPETREFCSGLPFPTSTLPSLLMQILMVLGHEPAPWNNFIFALLQLGGLLMNTCGNTRGDHCYLEVYKTKTLVLLPYDGGTWRGIESD